MNIQIQVTAEDIREGTAQECCLCPVARAIARALGREVLWNGDVSVDGDNVTVYRPSSWDGVDLPDQAKDFIEQFDSGKPVEPFAFALDVPEWWMKGGA
jgi:hypothetical protein